MMDIKTPPQRISLSGLKVARADVLEILNNQPIVITRYGEIVAHLISAEMYGLILKKL
jgi:hypothetical protein